MRFVKVILLESTNCCISDVIVSAKQHTHWWAPAITWHLKSCSVLVGQRHNVHHLSVCLVINCKNVALTFLYEKNVVL